MTTTIVLDSSPLGLLTQRVGVVAADECRQWIGEHLARGAQAVIPEIVDYELRRELLRSGRTRSINRLDQLIAHPSFRYLPVTTTAMRLAAQLWAQLRQCGLPTADVRSIDVDAILAAQIIDAGIQPPGAIVATENVGHLSRMLPADLWRNIR